MSQRWRPSHYAGWASPAALNSVCSALSTSGHPETGIYREEYITCFPILLYQALNGSKKSWSDEYDTIVLGSAKPGPSPSGIRTLRRCSGQHIDHSTAAVPPLIIIPPAYIGWVGARLSRTLRTAGQPDTAKQAGAQAICLCIAAPGTDARFCESRLLFADELSAPAG